MPDLVFISSVQKELAEERKAIRDPPATASYRATSPCSCLKICPQATGAPTSSDIEKVDQCSVFISLFAAEYGWEDPTDG